MNFYFGTSADDKMVLMNMVDELDVNHKVGEIGITLSNNNIFS